MTELPPLDLSTLPPACQPSAAPNWFGIFSKLRDHWLANNQGRNLTQLAARLGVHKQKISQWATGSGDASPAPQHIFMQLCHELGYVIVLGPEGAVLFKAPTVASAAAEEAGAPAAVVKSTDPALDARVRAAARETYEVPNEDNVAIHTDAPVTYAAGDPADGKGNAWVQAWLRVDLDEQPAESTLQLAPGGPGTAS